MSFPDPLPGILPFGSICLLSGPPHRGKTALLCTLLARLIKGQTLFGLPTTRPPAIAFLVTDHKHQLNQSQWLDRAGILQDVQLYSLRNDLDFKWARLRDQNQRIGVFEDCLAILKLPPGSLLIVDPVALFISSRLNDYHAVAVGLGEIDQSIQRHQLTLWGSAHTAKQTEDPKRTYKRAIDRIAGSGAQIGFADTAMALVGPDDTGKDYYELVVSPSMVREFTFKYQRNTEGLFIPYVSLDGVGTAPTPSEDALAYLLPYIPDDIGIQRHELFRVVQAAVGISLATLKRDLAALVKEGRVAKTHYGIYTRRKSS